MFKKIAVLSVASLMLYACQSGPGAIKDVHTGKTVVHSSRYSIGDGLLVNVHATAAYSSTSGYNVTIEHLATGGNWMFFDQAWSYGKQYRFIRTNQKLYGCAGGCTFYETGSIIMNERDFSTAANNGFDFALVGQGGTIRGKVPAKAFQQVLNQMRKTAP